MSAPKSPFSPAQLQAFEISARISSSVSLVAILFTLITFLTYPQFNKPITRLVYYATWTNLIGIISPLIARSGIEAGVDSSLCQFQGFIINFFNIDVYWALCIAINVYLVFFRRYTTEMLRKLEWIYMIACYVPQMIISFVYLFIKTPSRGKVYGNATTWCWITPKWAILRMTTVYGPVWVCCGIAAAIYLSVGIKIARERRRLLSFGLHAARSNSRPNADAITKEVVVGVSTELRMPSKGSASSVTENADETNYRATVHTQPNQVQSGQGLASDSVALAYARFASLFFLSMMVTWIAPSANRIYGITQPDKPIFALNLLMCILLPLQGFWNCIIYIAASLPACRALWRDIQSQFNFSGQRRLSG